MKAIDQKLFRDLKTLGGQILTITLLVAAGIIAFVAMQSTYRSMEKSKEQYYTEYRFAEVFASARRVPDRVEPRLREIPGVSQVYTRSRQRIRVPIEGQTKVPSGEVLTLPDDGTPTLNQVYIKRGRMPDPARDDEALLLDAFAEKYEIEPGDTLPILINGSSRQVLVTGLAMSPEYVLALDGNVLAFEPGSFAVLWMRRSAVAPAFEMKGAFNDVVFKLQPGAVQATVIDGIDYVLEPYGGAGAYGREDHVSDHYIVSELQGLKAMATTIPLIFLGVAAFLVNVVLGRLIELQRGQIATLKAVGYSDRSIGLHYLKLVSLIIMFGAVVGVIAGGFLGESFLQMYTPYFRFPVIEYYFDLGIVATAVIISLAAALVGAFKSVRSILAMAPAEAMRPPSPPTYHANWFDSVIKVALGPMGRMVVRELRRRPARALISIVGIALAVGIMVLGRFASDSMENLIDLQYGRAMTEDFTVSFSDPVPLNVQNSLLALPGVRHVEGMRSVPVKLRAGPRSKDTVLMGLSDERRLRSIINRNAQSITLPLGGIVLTDVLAEQLGVKSGDSIHVELLEGARTKQDLFVAGTVTDMLGMQGYMRRSSLHEFLGQQTLITTALLDVDHEHLDTVERRLQDMPTIGSVSRPSDARTNFKEQQGGLMLGMSVVLTFFASIIAIGVVYNNARVTLSMRSRDLASMRVLGFSRGEISVVLLGELAIHVLCALPLGMWLGTIASGALLAADPENFRMPAVINPQTYAFAAIITIATALISGLLVRRKLDQLDLIGVLKTRE